MKATFGNHLSVVELLLKSGAEVKIADENGNTALDRALNSNNKEILALLLRYTGEEKA
jgi:ankyrin repeat protein